MSGQIDTRSRSPLWGVVLTIGVLAVILGLVVVFNPFDSVRFVTVVVGASLMVAGVLGIVAAIRGTSRIGVAGPIVGLIGGLVLVILPEGSVKTAAVVAGIVFMAFGIVTVVLALTSRHDGSAGATLAGVLLAVVGLVVVVWPGPSLALLAFLAGVGIILFGIGTAIQAFRMRGS